MMSLKEFIESRKEDIKLLTHYKKLKKFLNNNGYTNFTQEDIFCLVNDFAKPACPKYVFVSFSVGYRTCEKNCKCYTENLSKKVALTKSAYTAEEKQNILDKRKHTTQSKYGVNNVFQYQPFVEKSTATKLSKYNDENYNNRDKAKDTCVSMYGVDNPSKNAQIKDKIKNTNLVKYGCPTPLQNSSIRDKIRLTTESKYGVAHHMMSAEVRDKIKNTNLQKYGVDNYSRINYSAETIRLLDDKDALYSALQSSSVLLLAKENNISLTPLYRKIKEYGFTEFVLSGFHREVLSFIRSVYTGPVLTNDRKILAGKELDIYIPEFNLAIECNGTYWHSDLNGKDRYYHKNKSDLCKNNGIQLIHIWEHTWNSKKHVIESIILNKFKMSKKIYARKCTIRCINSATAKAFVSNNHIQSGTNSSVALGLFYDNNLVSVMTFGKSRFNKNYEWELLRFCNLQTYTVVGAASRLFSYFVKCYNPRTVITYSDYSLTTGAVYRHLGFSHLSYSPPSYFYTNDYVSVQHRINFQKKRLPTLLADFNPTLTEWQNMVKNGYDRIWDCGNDVWSWENV